MKKLSKFLFTSVILLFILTLFLGFQIFSIKNEPKIHSLPALYVDGNAIKRSDNHNKVQLKGVSTLAFCYKNYPINQLFGMLEKIKLWNINLLGIFVNYYGLENKTKDLDQVVNWAEKNNVYIYLMPRIHEENNKLIEINQYPLLMNQLAHKYSKKTNIIYGLWAEPSIEWSEWLKLADEIMKEIIKEKSDALILMTGNEYARSININNKPTYTNIIYDFHSYPVANINELQLLLKNNNINFFWKDTYKQNPILIGEFGGVWESGFGSQEDLSYIQKVLNEVNKNKLNYSAYTIDRYNDVYDELGLELINWSTLLPTKKGELIKNDLLSYPPTDFSK